ncbi:hypothetical protein GPJ56_008079 [Histomonas meleagridis]|uniref:uncharacterized protein n=1 Tax=Histomonas meleagridis TaxID=135588 RepID=UPI003559E81B|nr:hypothetical protein GPJ56_008079 [Histomonas meleagridis]KAH0798970.1 hypothetical protein GO595_008260 [Histomonas meleagridis]
MEKWSPNFTFQNDPETGYITCLSFSMGNDYLAAGTSKGDILLFNQKNSWSQVNKIVGTSLSIDERIRDVTRSPVYDLDFIPIKRHCPLLLTLGSQEIRILSISNHEIPLVNEDFQLNGMEFPIFSQTQQLFSMNEVTRCNPRIGCNFSSLKCSPNGIDFSYTESTYIVVRRIEHLNPSLQVYTSEEARLTRLDYSPTDSEVILVGDEVGFGNIIDTRIQPHQSVPSRRTMPSKVLTTKPRSVLDCRFSSDGTKFFTRHFGYIMFWDLRNTSNCLLNVTLSHEHEHDVCGDSELFRSCWVNNDCVATGSYASSIYIASLKNNLRMTKYATENLEKPKTSFNFFAKKKSSQAKECCVHAVESRGDDIAVSNNANVHVYKRS